MSKHTPGPWKLEHVEDEGHVIAMASRIENEGCYRTCHCLEWDHGIEPDDQDWDEVNATAKLIAAAPDLLEALESFLRAPSVGSAGPGSVTIVVQDFNLRAAHAAIAKATA